MAFLSFIMASVLVVDVIRGQELVLKPPGEVFSRSLGSSMVISCAVSQMSEDSINNYELHWIDHNNIEVRTKTGRVYIEDDGSDLRKLYVTGIRESDAGMYTCRSKISGQWQQKSIRLVVYKEITFDDAPLVQNPVINSDALILCKVSGNPVPQVSWQTETGRIHLGGKFEKTPDGLLIHGITEADNGYYTCRAEVETDGRYNERRIQVAVHIPPKITSGLTAQDGVQGTDLAMSCKASGLPSPLYEFFKDDGPEPIVNTNRIHVENTTGNIYFSPLDKKDKGKYTCRVSNGAGNDTSFGELQVYVPPTIETMPEIAEAEGDTAIIECRSFGDPMPEMTFHRVDLGHDYEVGQNDNGRIIVSSPTSGLLVMSISNLVPSDSGNFTCRARSMVGSDEATSYLRVLFRPRFYENQSNVEYIWAGKTQNMTCSVSSEPTASIEWLRDGNFLRNNETFQIFSSGRTSSLQIRVKEADQGWIYGSYVCRARNKLGENEVTIQLQRASVPDAPKLVSVMQAFPTTVILKTVAPEEDGGMEVLGYRVEYEDRVQDFSLGDEIRIEYLKPSTTYIFRVRAKNEVGIGLGREISAPTAAIRQPYPIELTSPQEGSEAYAYMATWKPPITGGLSITQFKFSYRKVSVDKDSFNISQPLEDWIVYSTGDQPLHYYRLEDLQPLSYYELEIRTQNSMGWSEPNRQFVFLTAEDLFATTSTSTFSSTTLALSSSQTPASASTSETAAAHSSIAALPIATNNETEFSGTETLPKSGPSEAANIAIPIVIVVVILFLLFLLIIDISCYFMNNCGLTMFICIHMCGRDQRKFKDKSMEEGERSVVQCFTDKKPLSEDVVQEMEPLAAYHSGDSEYKVSLRDETDHGLPIRQDNGVKSSHDDKTRLRNVAEADESEC